MENILEAKNVKRIFGKGTSAVYALQDVSLTIPKNRLVVLKGRSGSGKTTLLNLLGALDYPTEGDVIFEEQRISGMTERERTLIRRKRMGFVFQSFGLLPLMSALENVEFGLRIAGVPRSEWKSRAMEALESVGLDKRASHRPFEMSGGEQQRCAIARAIAHRPRLILADEPTAELDSKMTMSISRMFSEYVRSESISIVMTTHDPAVMEVADDVYALEDGTVIHAHT
ncbi:ABC transporter ATP-binding protein [Brevibacillus ginsengisoli]|uniref:ABC transporter ATP-binding protein n=1 Tax=Brevibacillus ginsengisoli TaxID=363854 RepID=UPI003CEE2235